MQEIEKKYPGFIHMKLLHGIRLSFRLQQIVQNDKIVVRGYRVKNEGELPSAMNGYLYSIMRNTKSQRRAILMNLLKQFDETSVSGPHISSTRNSYSFRYLKFSQKISRAKNPKTRIAGFPLSIS